MRRPRRDGAERRSRRGGANNSDGGGDRVAAAGDRWRRKAIKARGHNNSDGGGEEGAAAEERWHTFEVAGKMLHSGDIGQLCSHKHKDNIKMMLLTGLVMGEKFGPCTYRERIAWAAKGSPPNIVNLLARLVEMRQQKIVKR